MALPCNAGQGNASWHVSSWYCGPCRLIGHTQTATEPLRVVTTVPDLGSLVREVGGEQVEVTVLVKGAEDPHFMEAKPSFIKSLSQADMYVQVGMEAEVGWSPVLLQQARNARVLPGAPGYVDAATVITPSGSAHRVCRPLHGGRAPLWESPLLTRSLARPQGGPVTPR